MGCHTCFVCIAFLEKLKFKIFPPCDPSYLLNALTSEGDLLTVLTLEGKLVTKELLRKAKREGGECPLRWGQWVGRPLRWVCWDGKGVIGGGMEWGLDHWIGRNNWMKCLLLEHMNEAPISMLNFALFGRGNLTNEKHKWFSRLYLFSGQGLIPFLPL